MVALLRGLLADYNPIVAFLRSAKLVINHLTALMCHVEDKVAAVSAFSCTKTMPIDRMLWKRSRSSNKAIKDCS